MGAQTMTSYLRKKAREPITKREAWICFVAIPLGALLLVLLTGCVSASISNDVPQCERLVPPGLSAAVAGAAVPDGRLLPDGHQDATPWIEGFVAQSGQLEIANQRAPAVDHIYRTCLTLHREALRRSQRGFLGRIFGG